MKKIFIPIIILILLTCGYFLYQNVILEYISPINIELIGNEEVSIEVFGEYKEEGAKANFRGEDITKHLSIKGDVNTSKVGTYTIEYIVDYENKKEIHKRKVNVIDTVEPEIELIGENKYSIYLGTTFNDPGIKVTDNYDEDISKSIVIDNDIDNNKVGIYKVTYTSTDSSGNSNSITREVEVTDYKNDSQGIAVINYHFFYEPGENCNESICLSTTKFEEQLKYLKDNGYKTLTMDEFVHWMYGEIELPEKSVLLTIDDGAMGTGAHNGNKLIPLLEKYESHATLFLITGWWDISNYQSKYLDVESHTNDMHMEGLCAGVTRGAQMLCSSYDVALADLRKSIEITGSSNSFCYPFYVYNQTAINLVKEAGFKVAFAGGGYKATRNSNKYAIPRYPIYSSTSLNTFINYIS